MNLKHPWKKLLFVAAFGGLGGGVNAFLCLVRIPQAVGGNPHFRWPVVPGGALHGAALAVIPFAVAAGASHWPRLLQVLSIPVVGWVAGYVSWIPLHRWGVEESWSNSVLWLFGDASWASVALTPFLYFGLVAVTYVILLMFGGLSRSKARHAASGVCAGVLGSLWWWIDCEPWYFAVIHGTVWGLLVGLAASRVEGTVELRRGG